jgi:hypothetical protein
VSGYLLPPASRGGEGGKNEASFPCRSGAPKRGGADGNFAVIISTCDFLLGGQASSFSLARDWRRLARQLGVPKLCLPPPPLLGRTS